MRYPDARPTARPTRPRRHVMALAAVVMLGLAVTACGGDAGTDAPAPGADEPSPDDPAALPEDQTSGDDVPASGEDEPASGDGPAPTVDDGDPASDLPEGATLVTEDDDGRTIPLTVGDLLVVRLSSAWSWDQAGATGALEITPVDHFADPGYAEWHVTAGAAGPAELAFDGSPNCADEQACPPRTVTVSLDVLEASA
ncbi:hypothetical protein [Egicoccus sp. AB-alg2]|uniref:hypothetical protein n=1 Tax=Egicoccus sp. AB-alg2 TaxID=3242693 RepID=UPI00359DBF8E